DWFLTLPIGPPGDPESIDQPELLTYSSKFFRLTPEADGIVFRAPAGGVTTENSTYSRSELREMNGEEKAAWSNTSGTHVLETRQAITETPRVKPEVVSAQIHDGGDDVLQIRLEGRTLTAQYDDGDQQVVIDPAYVLGTPYDLRIVAADGRIAVFYNGRQAADIERSGEGWYWKIGAYTQSNPAKGESPDAAGEVVVYSLSIQHTED
ncbi:MAG: polysaccharide lyase family 7 protein, partial [Pseudonocardia sp.]